MGFFIVFEGPDGCGKSTQIELVRKTLAPGFEVESFREPGSTALGERVRALLLQDCDVPLAPRTELLLFFAARAQLVAEKIAPALEAGKIVLLDRYWYSTAAYQGASGKTSIDQVRRLAVEFRFPAPDLVILLDGDPEKLAWRRKGGRDRFEARGLEFQKAVRAGFLEMAQRWPETFRVIDSTKTKKRVAVQIFDHVSRLVNGPGALPRAAGQ